MAKAAAAKPTPKPTRCPTRRRRQGRAAALLSRDAADPPLRGARGPALRHGADRRLLPPLHRPGSHRGRRAGGQAAGRPGHHRLPRPRPHAGRRHGPEGGHGRADRPRRRLVQGQGRLDAHVRRPRPASTAATASSAPRSRSAPAWRFANRYRGDGRSPSPTSATARPTRARSTRASTWPSSGSCRSST